MLAHLSLEELLDRIGSATPSSGSGTAAAAVLAMAIACLRKAIAVSLKHKPDEDALHGAEARLFALADQALAAADADAQGFPRLLAAERNGTQAERSDAAEDLVAFGKRLLSLCEAVRAEADGLNDHVIKTMANDILAGRVLSIAAASIVQANEDENAGLI